MPIAVDQELCISCGACIDTCPEVFDWNEDDKAHNIVDEVPADMEDQAREAAEGCPTNAITLD
ncbi:ferredoxin [Pelotomaculum propionicicum]|uniref:Ferredoxin n=1 Tax=Pelotomaculum propionicicum TaxID=258475 RepID=A0A4Y7RQ57_9FIRM|nr:ferredoxin [Pelotomaculum propionicicum]NLI13861.1 ferredoxin [Peptococcaceae bacterium]TEB10936.1 Ferredoxin [Pelotomaculum propionicicum]